MNEAGTELNIVECFSTAWKSFRKWWIPICLVAALVIVFNILPRILAQQEIQAVAQGGTKMMHATTEMDIIEMEAAAYDLQGRLIVFAREFLGYIPLILPLTAVLTIILLLYANRAAASERRSMRLPLWKVLHTALIHFLLALVKAAAFLCCIVPGVYLYIKLYFVPLIMLDHKCGASQAVRRSWIMTEGNFWRLFTLVAINGTIQIVALPSIIGAIPATGYANTVRATAYRQLIAANAQSN